MVKQPSKTLLLLFASLIGFSLAIGGEYNLVDAETYRDYNGELLSEEQYVQRVNICETLMNTLPEDTDCMEYALTKEIYDIWYIKYVVSEKFEKFLDARDIELE